MPRGPKGEKRPADASSCAVQVAQIATGERTENLPSNKRNGGKAGGAARAKNLTPERRSELASKASRARWKPLKNEVNA